MSIEKPSRFFPYLAQAPLGIRSVYYRTIGDAVIYLSCKCLRQVIPIFLRDPAYLTEDRMIIRVRNPSREIRQFSPEMRVVPPISFVCETNCP